MKPRNLFLITASLFTLLNISFAADGDSTAPRKIHKVELNAIYAMESLTANKFLGMGLVNKYELTPNGELCAILNMELMYGIFGSKKVTDANFLAGLRSGLTHGQFGIYYEVSTGIGFMDNHDGFNSDAGIFTRLKTGFRFSSIALEFTISKYVGSFSGKVFSIGTMGGVGVAVCP